MYRINNLYRDVLITSDEVIAKAAVESAVDIRLLQSSIEVAEERWIAPALGNAFYEDFISKKNVLVTNGNKAQLLIDINNSLAAEGKSAMSADDLKVGMVINAIELVDDDDYKNLWYRFLWKIVAEAVDVSMTVPTWLRNTGQGQQMNNPNVIGGNGQGSATGGRRDIEFKIDKLIQDRINPLIDRMHLWLCDRKDLYPLYAVPCACEEDGINIQSKGGFIFGIYDEEEEVPEVTSTKPGYVKVDKSIHRLQFLVAPGQTKYPVEGQVDEAEIRDELIGATFESLSFEGVELFIGDNPGETQGLNSVTGEVEWNEAPQYETRAILKYRK